jgi:hypothetical protein
MRSRRCCCRREAQGSRTAIHCARVVLRRLSLTDGSGAGQGRAARLKPQPPPAPPGRVRLGKAPAKPVVRWRSQRSPTFSPRFGRLGPRLWWRQSNRRAANFQAPIPQFQNPSASTRSQESGGTWWSRACMSSAPATRSSSTSSPIRLFVHNCAGTAEPEAVARARWRMAITSPMAGVPTHASALQSENKGPGIFIVFARERTGPEMMYMLQGVPKPSATRPKMVVTTR